MPQTLLIESSTPSAIDAHVRNSTALCDELGWNIAYSLSERTNQTLFGRNWDNIIISSGTVYMDCQSVARVIKQNPKAQLWWMSNDYAIPPNSSVYRLLKERKFSVIASYPRHAGNIASYNQWHSLNLNLLLARPINQPVNKTHGLIYYGTFRRDRLPSFQRFLRTPFLNLSTSTKSVAKYKNIGCKFKLIGRLNWKPNKETLNRFSSSLYIEDEFTHRHFANMANRFYESLTCNCVMIFDRRCSKTLDVAGVIPRLDQVVSTCAEMDFLAQKIHAEESFRLELLDFQKKWADDAMAQREELMLKLQSLMRHE